MTLDQLERFKDWRREQKAKSIGKHFKQEEATTWGATTTQKKNLATEKKKKT